MKSQTETYSYPTRVHEAGEIYTYNFDLANDTGASIDTLVINPEVKTTETPTIIIPGFTEGITQDQRFATSLSQSTGGEVFVLGQYEREEKGSFIGSKKALAYQAEALLAVIEQNGYTNLPVNIFANSLGAAVFAQAAALAEERGWTCFKAEQGSHVVMMAPVGLEQNNPIVRALKVGKRFAIDGGLRAHLKADDGWDEDTLVEGKKLIKQDVRKALGEAIAAARAKIDFNLLKKSGVNVDIITSPKDGVMGQRALGKSIMKLLDDGHVNSWSTPYDTVMGGDISADDLIAIGFTKQEARALLFNLNSGAEHNAHMVNTVQASRTAGAVANLLR